MPYKDPEKGRENARKRQAAYRARHPGRHNDSVKAWYARNKERVLERLKKQYAADPEKFRERLRRSRARKKTEGRSDEMGLQIKRCPLCNGAGAAKVKGAAYLAGCSRPQCRKWVGGEGAVTGTTMEATIGAWNRWVEEELAEQEEAKRLEEEMAAEMGEDEGLVDVEDMDAEDAPDGEAPDEDEGFEDGDGTVDLIAVPEDAGGDDDGGDDDGEEAGEATGTTETAGTKEADEAEEDGGEGAAEETRAKRGYSFITDEEVEQWVRWRAEGMSVNKIAHKAGRSYRMVSDRLKAIDETAEGAAPPKEETPATEDGGEEDGNDGNEDTEAMKENEEPEAAEEDGETFARFELVLDGVRYWLETGADGCDGCAFCLTFGKRQVCAAESSEDFKAARVLCGELEGQWREAEEE